MDEEASSTRGKWKCLSPDNEEDKEKIKMVTKMVKFILKMIEDKEESGIKDEWIVFYFRRKYKPPAIKPPNEEEVPEGSTTSDAQTPPAEDP